MVKKTLISIIFFVLILGILEFNPIYASNAEEEDSFFSGAQSFVSEGEKQLSKQEKEDKKQGRDTQTEKLANISNNVYNIVLAIAIIIAMAIGIIIGIKFMMASASEKAEIKELLIPYVAGCTVVFGAMGIWKVAVNIFSGF